jgi:hypothetical protein
LLANDRNQAGFGFGDWWYGVLRRWGELTLVVEFRSEEDKADVQSFELQEVKWQGLPIISWFEKKLYDEHRDKLNEKAPQVVEFVLEFDEERLLEIRNKSYPVKRVGFRGTSIHKHKRLWVTWSGDALYDWHTGMVSIPSNGVLAGSSVPSNLAEWPDFDGDIPPADDTSGFVRMTLYEELCFKEDVPVPDLSIL